MNKQSFNEFFRNISEIDSFKRVDVAHILDLYLGLDQRSRYTLFLNSKVKAEDIISSKLIDVVIGKRKDTHWGISFSLLDNNYADIFFAFCDDIIESSRNVKNKDLGTAFICERYNEWQKMLSKNPTGLLSNSEIKGLIGELFFLKEILINKYGEEIAINSWIGPEMADQDFVCPNEWYEIKATVSGAEQIKISSIEQLDVNTTGYLVIVYLDKTSKADNKKISLNSIVNDLLLSLTKKGQEKLKEILFKHGYIKRDEYEEIIFKFSKIEYYIVNNNFPSIKRKNIPNAVIEVTYDLSIHAINLFFREGIQ